MYVLNITSIQFSKQIYHCIHVNYILYLSSFYIGTAWYNLFKLTFCWKQLSFLGMYIHYAWNIDERRAAFSWCVTACTSEVDQFPKHAKHAKAQATVVLTEMIVVNVPVLLH